MPEPNDITVTETKRNGYSNPPDTDTDKEEKHILQIWNAQKVRVHNDTESNLKKIAQKWKARKKEGYTLETVLEAIKTYGDQKTTEI